MHGIVFQPFGLALFRPGARLNFISLYKMGLDESMSSQPLECIQIIWRACSKHGSLNFSPRVPEAAAQDGTQGPVSLASCLVMRKLQLGHTSSHTRPRIRSSVGCFPSLFAFKPQILS